MGNAALNTATTGMMARETDIAVISNNLANLNTTAYKRYRAEFQDLIYQTLVSPGTPSDENGNIIPTGVQVGLGTKLSSTYPILEQGELLQTSSTYDLAIAGPTGKGYFAIELPDGTLAYTRAGTFKLSKDAEIINSLGYVVSPGITIPPNTIDVQINSSGQVFANVSGNPTPVLQGQFDLFDFPNAAGLQPVGDNLYKATQASGNALAGKPSTEGMGDIMQGWLETSNVDPIVELTTLITAQRGYELCSNIIKAADEMQQTVNRLSQ